VIINMSSTNINDSIPRIRKLDEVVVNRIAAGEVIQRPANAIKELIENSLDAGSKSIQVTVKSGGLKLLQIQDDGCGIRKEDMPILCERFTTSKLGGFEDLRKISTYGFRGEALASISHIAHLTITTKTADSPCAYKAKYEDGKLVPLLPSGNAEPKACAGNKGTQISAEDLFYNVAVRRKALKNPNEEHAKIVDVISKYAIHNAGVSFTLKKAGENIANVRTNATSSVVDNIKAIYGPSVSRELLEVEHTDEKLEFKVKGHISNANYSLKKCVFLLFINHRLVESPSLRRALDTVYVNYLPKDKHPFMYLSLEVNPGNIDVNVHPTKHEVKFLHEDMIIESIQKCVETKLLGSNESRHFYTQSLLPKMVGAEVEQSISDVVSDPSGDPSDASKKICAHQMVRTDAREQKIQAFFGPSAESNTRGEHCMDTENSKGENMEFGDKGSTKAPDNATRKVSVGEPKHNTEPIDVDMMEEIPRKSEKRKRSSFEQQIGSKLLPPRREIKLSSIKTLMNQVDENESAALKGLLEDHKFVGCVDRSLALIQHLTRLYLVNYERLGRELLYQIMLSNFGNFGFIDLSSPAPIYELALLALDCPDNGWTEEDGSKEELADFVLTLLQSKAEMLLDYFSIEINDKGELLSLPLILDKLTPNMNGLPMFILRLATEVDWESEQACFETFCRECSRFFSPGPDPLQVDQSEDEENNESGRGWRWSVEHVLFPALRTGLLPPKKFSEDGTFLEVANLPDLYKVFERC